MNEVNLIFLILMFCIWLFQCNTLTFENKTALQYAQPNERATAWDFLEGQINMEGRQKILQLFNTN